MMKKSIKILISLVIITMILLVLIIFNKKQNVNKIYPSVVHIECKNDKTLTVGSGIVFESKDNILYIVTNYHVIKGYSRINVYDEDFNKEVAKIINYDEQNDIALLAIRNNLNVREANFDIKSKLKEKEEVYVLTSFRGKDSTYIVKNAIVSKLNDKIDLNNKKFNTIKLSYNVENGDSGSPVINKKGKVIGMVISKDKEVVHYAYALPIDFVLSKIKKLININPDQLSLGAVLTNSTNIELLKEYDIDSVNKKGVIILSLKEKYPLYEAGLRKGDLLVEFDNIPITNIEELKESISKHKKNDEVTIKYYRNSEIINTKIKLNR